MVKYKEIYEKLRDDIISGVYPARTYLPKEGELMKMFSVSRDTIRKALTQLATQELYSEGKRGRFARPRKQNGDHLISGGRSGQFQGTREHFDGTVC